MNKKQFARKDIEKLLHDIALGKSAYDMLLPQVRDIALKIIRLRNKYDTRHDTSRIKVANAFSILPCNNIRIECWYPDSYANTLEFPTSYLADPKFLDKETARIAEDEAAKRQQLQQAMAKKDKEREEKEFETYLALEKKFKNKKAKTS